MSIAICNMSITEDVISIKHGVILVISPCPILFLAQYSGGGAEEIDAVCAITHPNLVNLWSGGGGVEPLSRRELVIFFIRAIGSSDGDRSGGDG